MVSLAIFVLKDFGDCHVRFLRPDDLFINFMAVGFILQ
jgi:hypothetical protein